MRRLIVTEFLTLGGVMEEPTPWQQGYSSPETGAFKREELFGSGALLLGRVTYQEFVGYWPTATGTGASGERMNSLPKFVAATTLEVLEWNAAALSGDVASAVRAEVAGGRRPAHLRQWHPRPDAAAARPGRRASPDGLSARPRARQAPLLR